ncbi:MAG TPA: hypothetical protein VL326_02695 [Kofleriaceae bacterium]|nr:hypothetical protein [Kofleriaceae bacterium]
MKALAACVFFACGSAGSQPAPESPPAATPWQVPAGWKHELIPFPLEFAPALGHAGVEELRFAPGFFDPAAPGYWAYAFVWRLDGRPVFDAPTVAAALTTYFRGLVAAVDEKHEIADRESIRVTAAPAGAQLALTAHVIDPFTTKQPVDLAGTAKQLACPAGAVWVFTFAPVGSAMRDQVTALATLAACGQPATQNSRSRDAG